MTDECVHPCGTKGLIDIFDSSLGTTDCFLSSLRAKLLYFLVYSKRNSFCVFFFYFFSQDLIRLQLWTSCGLVFTPHDFGKAEIRSLLLLAAKELIL